MVITLSCGRIYPDKNFANSVFPTPVSPQMTKFIFVRIQLISNAKIFLLQYSCRIRVCARYRGTAGAFRIQKARPVLVTDSCTAVIRSSSDSASKIGFAGLNCCSTAMLTLLINTAINPGVIKEASAFLLTL